MKSTQDKFRLVNDGKMLKKITLHTEHSVPEQSFLSKFTVMLKNLKKAN